MGMRYAAARRAVETILLNSNVRLPMTEEMLDMATRVIMLFSDMDEQRQRSEKLLGPTPSPDPLPTSSAEDTRKPDTV